MFWWIFVMLDGCVMNHTFNQFIKKILYTNLTIKGQIHTCSQISILVLLNWLFSRLASNDVLDSRFWLIISVSLNRQDLFFFWISDDIEEWMSLLSWEVVGCTTWFWMRLRCVGRDEEKWKDLLYRSDDFVKNDFSFLKLLLIVRIRVIFSSLNWDGVRDWWGGKKSQVSVDLKIKTFW